jgi:hypothetical protein
VLIWGVEVAIHTFISFGIIGITHSIYVIFIDGVISDDSLTISLYLSECGEDETRIERKVYSFSAVPIQIHRIRKLSLSPTVNTVGVTGNTTVSIKIN